MPMWSRSWRPRSAGRSLRLSCSFCRRWIPASLDRIASVAEQPDKGVRGPIKWALRWVEKGLSW